LKIRAEIYDPKRHHNPMGWSGADPDAPRGQRRPWHIEAWPAHKVVFVRVCDFDFEFHDRVQLDACIRCYSKAIRPSGRLPVYTENFGAHHGATQRWFERLPLYLREEPKRLKVLKALDRAFREWDTLG
jgi:hypothetical protein